MILAKLVGKLQLTGGPCDPGRPCDPVAPLLPFVKKKHLF